MSYTPTEWETGDIVTAEKLNKIEGGIAAADGELPAVTSDDNGNVLTVVNGAWAKALPPGAVYVFHAEYNDETGKLVTTEKAAEIVAAFNAGKNLEAVGFPGVSWTVAGAVGYGFSLVGETLYPIVSTGENLMEMDNYVSSVVADADLEEDPFVLDITVYEYTLTPAEE